MPHCSNGSGCICHYLAVMCVGDRWCSPVRLHCCQFNWKLRAVWSQHMDGHIYIYTRIVLCMLFTAERCSSSFSREKAACSQSSCPTNWRTDRASTCTLLSLSAVSTNQFAETLSTAIACCSLFLLSLLLSSFLLAESDRRRKVST